MPPEIDELRRLLAEQRERTFKTCLAAFLDGLHKHLFLGLEVQQAKAQSTPGDTVNATIRLRPRRLKAWDTFAGEQDEIWRILFDSPLVEDRLFTSLHALEELGESTRRQPLRSEFDLHHFLRRTVENPVSRIVEELYNDPILRWELGLRGSICFENHSNTLSLEQPLQDEMEMMDVRPTRRRSQRIAARQSAFRPGRPFSNQICVYNCPKNPSESSHRIAACIKEYKSPNEVTLSHIYEGMHDMDVDEVLKQNDKFSKVQFQHALVALLSQPFDYIIRAHTKVGVLSTGEADIYLRVKDDTGTLFYHLSVPKGDVGDKTGWDPHSDCSNRLHLTAVGQSLAFTLQALRLKPQSQAWGLQATNTLPRWEVSVPELLDNISNKEVPSSEYRPRPNSLLRMSPIQPRRRRSKPSISGCQPSDTQGYTDDDHPDSDTRSRDARVSGVRRRQPTTNPTPKPPATRESPSGENRRRYCTLKCLRGLAYGKVYGDELDQACPNVLDHGTTRHTIDARVFLKRLRHQLSEAVNADCESLGIHGSRGALLKVTLSSHGYTVPAKCTVSDFADYLRHEAVIYDKLRPIQGIHIPIYLGSIDLVHPYSYDGIAYLEHMMLLSPSGQPFDMALRETSRESLISKMEESLSEIHRLNVLHKDPATRN